MNTNRYFPFLDGFRAIASLLVMLVHTYHPAFQSGWIGVPMFFVLSSFLITNILFNYKNSGNYFKTFYFRRILRIFPIYYLTLFFCLVWGLFIKVDVSQFFYFFFYVQCFSLSHQLEPVFSNGLMGHTWSLSVEEIFYLLWPAVVYFLKKRHVSLLCISLMAISFIYKCFQVEENKDTLALLSFLGNLDCLMIGALLSIYITKPEFEFKNNHKLLLYLFLLFAVFLIILPYFNLNNQQLLTSKIALSFVTGWLSFFVILYLISANTGRFVKLFLDNKLINYLGKISYGTYLYHILVFMFISSLLFHFKIILHPIIENLLKIIVTYLLAIFSWKFIEKPILGLKTKMNY